MLKQLPKIPSHNAQPARSRSKAAGSGIHVAIIPIYVRSITVDEGKTLLSAALDPDLGRSFRNLDLATSGSWIGGNSLLTCSSCQARAGCGMAWCCKIDR